MLSTGDGCRASALTWLIFDMMRFAVRGDNAGQLFAIREQTASCYNVAHLQLKFKATQGKCEIPLGSSVVAIWSFFFPSECWRRNVSAVTAAAVTTESDEHQHRAEAQL